MEHAAMMATILVGVCCVLLATRPVRGDGQRRSRPPAPPAHGHQPADPAAPAERSHPAEDDQRPGQPIHRNRWHRADLHLVFNHDRDAPSFDPNSPSTRFLPLAPAGLRPLAQLQPGGSTPGTARRPDHELRGRTIQSGPSAKSA